MSEKIKVGIVGGTGYTGVELIRLLSGHPNAEVVAITSRSESGVKIADMYPNLRGVSDLAFSEPSLDVLGACDLVFFATPHGVAMSMAQDLLDRNTKVIDLAADFRMQDIPEWEKWYGMEYTCESILRESVYGLPEANREAIQSARVIGNPGCYPTATQIGLMPLLQNDLIEADSIIVDGKSGISGAGRGAKVASLFSETAESFKAYGIDGHRHWPEIQERLNTMTDAEVDMMFVPHLVPMIRGIEISAYATLKKDVSEAELQALFEKTYANEPFVDVMNAGQVPETRMVKGSNMCRVAVRRPNNGKRVFVTSVIDNLVKGASGQAIQNMNLMFGIEETAGLDNVALMP